MSNPTAPKNKIPDEHKGPERRELQRTPGAPTPGGAK